MNHILCPPKSYFTGGLCPHTLDVYYPNRAQAIRIKIYTANSGCKGMKDQIIQEKISILES